MPLTRDQVKHIAKLSRLSLSDDDIAKFQAQLSEILDYFERLREVDTEDVPPMPYPLPLHNVMRDDQPRPSYPQETVLSNAPQREDAYFRVRAVFEDEE